MSGARKFWLGQGVEGLGGQSQVFLGGDFQVDGRTGDDGHWLADALDQFCIVGSWLSTSLRVGLQQKIFTKYLGRLGFPKVFPGHSLLDHTILANSLDGSSNGDRQHRSPGRGSLLENRFNPFSGQTRSCRIVDGHMVRLFSHTLQGVGNRIRSLLATFDQVNPQDGKIGAERVNETLAIFRRNHDQDLHHIIAIQKLVGAVQPHRAVLQRRKWLLVVAIVKSAALAGRGQDDCRDDAASEASSQKPARSVKSSPRSGPSVPPGLVSIAEQGRRRKEADEIRGILQCPTVAGWPGWRRDVIRCMSAAATWPQQGVDMILAAERFEGNPDEFRPPEGWATLDAKLARELVRAVREPVIARQIATMEERTLRLHGRQLPGLSMYMAVMRQFRRDQEIAKPQAYEELAQVVYEGQLASFLARWDAAVERFMQCGDFTGSDEAFMYCTFKKQFLRTAEMKDHHATFRRSLSGTGVQTYDWMYNACRAVVEADRLESQARACVESLRPSAPNPAAPA